MNGFLDILSLIWDFVNHPIWVPVILAGVGIVFFAVTYIKVNRAVNKYRAEVQQKIVNNAYSDYIQHKYSTQITDEKSSDEKTAS